MLPRAEANGETDYKKHFGGRGKSRGAWPRVAIVTPNERLAFPVATPDTTQARSEVIASDGTKHLARGTV